MKRTLFCRRQWNGWIPMRPNNIWLRYLFLAAAAGICIGIFLASNQNAEASSATSGGIIRWVASLLQPGFAEQTAEAQETTVASYQHFVRKLAHFSVYAALGFTATGAALTWPRPARTLRVGAALAFCLLYAASDEIHQLFVPGRSGQASDVLLDFCGAVVGALALCLLLWLVTRRRIKKSPEENAS